MSLLNLVCVCREEMFYFEQILGRVLAQRLPFPGLRKHFIQKTLSDDLVVAFSTFHRD